MGAFTEPITLTGRHVQLEPLSLDHISALTEAAGGDRSTFRFTRVPDGLDETRRYVDELLTAHDNGSAMPFAQRRRSTDEVVGCTRYMEPRWWRGRSEPDEVEIGGTWLASSAQRTALNSEAKLLLLGHAFDVWNVWRVAICTDARNERSRRAIERLGALFEGVLRSHRLAADAPTPTPRDSAMYSVVIDDWPAVRERLVAKLAATTPDDQ